MIRVAHLITERDFRGGERQIRYLINGLDPEEIKSYAILRRGAAFNKFIGEDGVPHLKISSFNPLALGALVKTLFFLWRNNIDIIHAHSSRGHTFGYLMKIMGYRGRFVLTRRVNFNIKKKMFTLWKYRSRELDHIVCISKAIEHTVLKDTGTKIPTSIIYSAVDHAKFSGARPEQLYEDYPVKKGDMIIGFTSAFDVDKDPLAFIKAAGHFKTINSAPASWIMFGKGNQLELMHKMVEDKNLGKEVCIAGFTDKLQHYFPEFDVLVMPSVFEGLGSSILEAYLAGVVPIGTRTGGIPEVIIDQETGFLTDVGDYKKIAECISLLQKDRQLYERMKNNGRKFVKKFSVERMVEGNMRVYREVIG